LNQQPESTPSSLESFADRINKDLDTAQEQLNSLKEQLTESQRLAAIGTIAAVIAHEFNNILTPMISYSQYALQSAEGEKPDIGLIRKALSKSFQASTKAGKICNSMLSLARGETTFGAVSVQTLIDEVLLVLARDPQKDGIALRVQIQPGLAVEGDQVQLEQVLLNLMINARHAMLGKGGALTIKAGTVDNGQLRIQVIDTGPGIPEKLLPKIFQPFFTTKGTARRGESKGTGLGLSICKDIVEHHHGKIEVQSEVGRGTTFNIYLPGPQANVRAIAA
jgi:signal transduction histidine kinase